MNNSLKSGTIVALTLVALLSTPVPVLAANYDSNINCFGCAPHAVAEAKRMKQFCEGSRNRYNTLIHFWNNKWRFESPTVRKNAKLDIEDAKRDIQRYCR